MPHLRRCSMVVGMLAAALILAAGTAGARGPERLYLQGGDELSGVSLGVADGMLRWRTLHGVEMAVPLEVVDRIEYPGDSGSRLSEGSSAEGPAPLERPAPPAEPADSSADAADLVAADDAPLESPSPAFADPLAQIEDGFDYWTERIEVGGRVSTGNTDETFLNVLADFEEQRPTRTTDLELGGQYGKANGNLTTNRWYGNVTIDWNQTEDWIVFVTSKNEHDDFESLDYRGTLSSGLGYRFFNDDKRRLIVRVGPGVTHERFRSPRLTRTTPDLFGELELHWPVWWRIHFEHKATLHPSVEDFQIFRLVSNSGLLFQLDERERWLLKLGLRHEYNARPNAGRKPDDLMTSLLLVYTRK